MTETEARNELARPLVFGDELQIAAKLFLERVGECARLIESGEFDFGTFPDDVEQAAFSRCGRPDWLDEGDGEGDDGEDD